MPRCAAPSPLLPPVQQPAVMEAVDAIVDLGAGAMGAVAIEAEDSDAALAEVRARFPGCRLALVAHEMEEPPDMG